MAILMRWLMLGHRRYAALLLAGAATVVVAGGAAFGAAEHLPLTTGWYWAVTTATTVGYGDVTPHNPAGRLLASLVMLTAIPMVGASFALFTSSAILEGLRRLVGMASVEQAKGFRLVVGAHPATMAIAEELRRAGEEVVLVADVDRAQVPAGVRLVRGTPTSPALLAAARPERAADGLVGGTSDGDVLLSSVLLRERAPQLALTALVSSPTVAEALRELGVAQVLSADELLAHAVAKTLEAPHAGALLLRLLESEQERLVEEVVPAGAPRRSLSAVRSERDALVLGVVQHGDISLGVTSDPEVVPGDLLLVVRADGRARRAR